MKKQIMWLSAVLLTMLISAPVMADHHYKKCHCPKMMSMMSDKLNLTQEQKDKLKGIKEQAKTQYKQNRQAMKDLRTQMRDLAKSDKMDEAKLDQLVNQKKELVGSMTKMRVMMHHQLYSVLNAEQKKQLSEMKDKMKNKMNDNCPCMMMQKDGATPETDSE